MALKIVERVAKLSTVEPGMLLRVQYSTGIYNIFVVNENRRNPSSGKFQLHGYKLPSTITESDFVNIWVNMNSGLLVDSVNKEIRSEQMTDTEAYEMRYILRGVDERPYRTFNIEDIISITQLFIEMPELIDAIVEGNIVIKNKASKRQLLTCLQTEDDNCITQVPEIRERMVKSQDETAERESAATKIRTRTARNILNNP
jgi:hypothetical protein